MSMNTILCHQQPSHRVSSEEKKNNNTNIATLKDKLGSHGKQPKIKDDCKRKHLSRIEKENDKKKTDTVVAAYDLQAVFECPKGEISVFYYKSKLNVLNLQSIAYSKTELKALGRIQCK
ncbi:hypothetical protein HHI36_016658 [Cryptolaemus montrouzieri]|uniref:Uncharacterized protein n=1 Tax=Cryptolaemus montrouzieri TaxID=559131 RepID=A0ABD2NKK8_9CUCU